ncbi:MAG TPA: hypothetical protein VGN63_03645 [Flavisolibacter sp.]|jgi:hypothetical protein|nr:hypothetical protein [Flavisolibacter sp.]
MTGQTPLQNKQNPEGIEKGSILHSLPLTDYLLTAETLAAHTHASHLRKRTWDRPDISFIDWQDGALKLQLTWRSLSHRLTINVQAGQLLVGCNCQSEEGAICLHAYKALQSFLHYRGEDCFKKYRPGGEVAVAFQHRSYFDIAWRFYQLSVTAKKNLGTVYVPGKCRPGWLTTLFPSTPSCLQQGPHTKTACYFIVASDRKEMLPVLIPCMGTLSKDGRFIKSFEPFFSGTKKEYDHLLTTAQKALNLLCYRLWQAAESLPGTLLETGGPKDMEKGETVFYLWKQVFRFLFSQAHVFVYTVWRRRELKAKPEKKSVKKVQPCPGHPFIAFVLRKQDGFYQLTQTAKTCQGRPIPHFDAGLPFFLFEKDSIYLLSSLKDAVIANRMHRSGNKMTIFMEQYPAFREEVLQELEKHYSLSTLCN